MAFELIAGAVVRGRYRLERKLGRGGMGEVWAAEQLVTRKRVAMKFLVGEAAESPETARRFLREARAASAVQHPNVVQIHDVIDVEENVPALVMELLTGESLEAKLQREGKLAVEDALAIMLRVVSAVGTAHTLGVVHRDLKPDNIFLAETPEGTEVKVLDFGIAKIATVEGGAATAELTATGAMLGTPFYMSPEQAFGEKRIDHRADIWSLGIVMYRCLSGQLPTRADNLGQILKIIMMRSIPRLADAAPELPKAITELVDRMLGYTPSDRPSDLREVKATLEGFLRVRLTDFGAPAIDASSLGGVTSPLPEAAATETRASRRRVSSGAIALAVATLLTAATAGVVFFRDGSAGRGAASGRPLAGSVDVADPLPSQAPVLASAEDPEASLSVTPTAAGSATAPVVTPQRSQPGALPSSRPSTTPTATPTTKPSSGWGGIVEEPGF